MSERIARRAAQQAALGVTDTRGARFAHAQTGTKGPDFADLAAVPHWLILSPKQQEKVAQAVGLLQHRGAIKRELSGPRLTMLADAVGEDLLDAVCADNADYKFASNAPLPRPDSIAAGGWDIMHRSLPIVFAARFPGASGDPAARALAERAVDLVLGL